ncbi:16S rRNA (guanine(527)-N(7))-methyltransferase RsmG [Patescibacteria group bacterium]|nr:16S rRNA (guanine(527)-N(7))-methyltransferase RsmG [Patescibacteria group bacterium]
MGILVDVCNIDLNDEKIFGDLWDFYSEEMKKHNFTSIKGEKEFVMKHFVDSILALKDENYFKAGDRVLDIGSGGGFPGIPLAVVYKETHFVLLDSVGKKTRMMEVLKEKFNLKNVSVLNGRAEDFAHVISHRERYDFVVNRAIAKWSALLELSLPFLKVGGRLLAYKGHESSEDLAMADRIAGVLGAKLVNVHKYELPDEMGMRSLVSFVKEQLTGNDYPRKMGAIKNRSL